MVTLVVEGRSGSELTYELAKPTIAIGAGSENDVVVRMPGVASRHLVVQRNGDVFTFVAQHRQMVVLNGERRSRGVIRVGDRLRLGTVTLVFKEIGEDRVEPPPSGQSEERAAEEPTRRRRAEVALYTEPKRLVDLRRRLVELFRSAIRSNLIPSLRTFLEEAFGERQAMLAVLDEVGQFEPIVSRWSGELPRLPPQTFDELAHDGRYGVIRLRDRELMIYPVGLAELGARAYLLAETDDERREDDQPVVAELACMLAASWERVVSSSPFYGAWEGRASQQAAEQLPGTSHAILMLRDGVVRAAQGSHPVLLSGRPGSGRVSVATLIASIQPHGPLQVVALEAGREDEASLRGQLVASGEGAAGGLVERARGGALVVRDLEALSPTLQRELAAIIRDDLESGYGPSVRWMATSGDDCMGLLSQGAIEATLFQLFQHHLLRVPSLGERREDLPLLIVRLIGSVAAEQGKEVRGIELETLNALVRHPFDGQMTELLAELRRLVSATPNGEMVRGLVPAVAARQEAGEPEREPTGLLAGDDLKEVVPAVERLIIDRVLRRTMGNQSKAARILNLSRGALISKMKEYKVPDYRYLRRRS